MESPLPAARGMPQEALKAIACLTMLYDHIGAVILPVIGLRIIGRIAFPIFCFLLSEGVHYTRNVKKYALRLAIGMLLAEYPFDCLFFGGWTWAHQSVMVTLLLACLAMAAMTRAQEAWCKLLIALPFAVAAELLHTDYGAVGVLMCVMFALTRTLPKRIAIQSVLLLVLCYLAGGYAFAIGPVSIPIECFGVFAMLPIACYRGYKCTRSRIVQIMFYLFYPVHLTLLLLLVQFFR